MHRYFHSFGKPIRYSISAAYYIGYIYMVIGMGRPDNNCRETIIPIFLHEQVFAGNLIAGIFPVRIMQRSGFSNQIMRSGF